MTKVRLLGKIIPAEPKVSIQGLPGMNWLWQEQKFSFEFNVSVLNSIVEVDCTLPEYKPEFLVEILRRGCDLARAAINLAAFANGHGLTFRLDEFVDPEGKKTPLLPEDKRLPPLATALHGEGAFDQVFRFVAQDPTLIQLMGELIHAITVPHESPTSCAVAIEGLKNLISEPGVTDKRAWENMRDALRVDEAYLKLITGNSKNVRHGKGVRIEGDVTTEIASRSWIVMNRFWEYKKRGNAPLTEPEFPTLKG